MYKREVLNDDVDCINGLLCLNDEKFFNALNGNILLMNDFIRQCLREKGLSVIGAKSRTNDPVLRYNPVTFDIKAVDGVGRVLDIELTKLGKAFRLAVQVNNKTLISEEDFKDF